MAETWSAFCRRLEAVGLGVLDLDDVASPFTQAESIRYLTYELRLMLEDSIMGADTNRPLLLHQDELGHGPTGPNADNVYLRAQIRGDASYVLRGNIGSVFDVNISVHKSPDFAVLAERFKSDLKLDDGYFELTLGRGRAGSDAIALTADVSHLFIRVYYYDWDHETPPWFELTCISDLDRAAEPYQPEHLRMGLERTIGELEQRSKGGYGSLMMGWLRQHPVNFIAPLSFTSGGQLIKYGGTIWDVGPDDALIVESPVPNSRYLSFNLYTIPWFQPFDRAQRVTSLNGSQLHLDADGRVRVILAHRDPGVQNWLDLGGRQNGHLMYRWIWTEDEPIPTSSQLSLSDVRAQLPPETPAFSPEQRRDQIARRRSHLARRFQ